MKKILLFLCLIISSKSYSFTTISIGNLYDSTTYISEHYGLMEFLKSNPIGKTQFEYALTQANKEFFVTGKINSKKADITFFQNGKPTDKLTLNYTEKKFGKIFAFIRAKIIAIEKNNDNTTSIAQSIKYSNKNIIITIKKKYVFISNPFLNIHK